MVGVLRRGYEIDPRLESKTITGAGLTIPRGGRVNIFEAYPNPVLASIALEGSG
jgi:hypothetical protein